MPIELAQIPTILFSTGWTNHQIIMSRCKVITNFVLHSVCANQWQAMEHNPKRRTRA